MRPLQRSTTCGMSTVVAMSPVWPPPSLPCAQMMSTPASSAFFTCLGCPIMFMTGMPAACSLSTAQRGGTPMAQTKSDARSATITSMSPGSCPCV